MISTIHKWLHFEERARKTNLRAISSSYDIADEEAVFVVAVIGDFKADEEDDEDDDDDVDGADCDASTSSYTNGFLNFSGLLGET